MYTCLSCFSVFKPELVSGDEAWSSKRQDTDEAQSSEVVCPTSSCNGQVIEIDELILPVILILNYKGYQTKACCSGHVHQQISDTYVMFEEGVELPELVQGFHVDEPYISESGQGPRQNCVTIRKSHSSGDRLGSILLANKKLYDWARGLPNQNEQFIENSSEIEQRQNDLLLMKMLAMGFYPFKQNSSPFVRKKMK